jgi:hypothetical protein
MPPVAGNGDLDVVGDVVADHAVCAAAAPAQNTLSNAVLIAIAPSECRRD